MLNSVNIFGCLGEYPYICNVNRKDMVYIVCAFYDGVWNILQENGHLSWVFDDAIKCYKTQAGAEKMANRIAKRRNMDRVSVFKVDADIELSSSDIQRMADKMVYDIDMR